MFPCALKVPVSPLANDSTSGSARKERSRVAGPPPIDRIRAIPGFDQLVVEDHRVSGMFRGDFEPLLAALASSRVTKFESREPSLEEIFLGFYK